MAVWREALLAKAVLQHHTRGYRSHPQLIRFREHPDPMGAINTYLAGILAEARLRGYRFDGRKLRGRRTMARIDATRGQLQFEWSHLLRKLRSRAPRAWRLARATEPRAHLLFHVIPGPIAEWESAARPRRLWR